MVKLTNFQQISPSHVQTLFCPLLYIPSRPVDLRVWTRNKQCASISCIAPLYRWGEKSSLYFPFSFPSVVSRFADHWLHCPESRRYTGFHCAPIGEGEKEREWDREGERESQQAADGGGAGGRRGGRAYPGLPGGRLVPLHEWVIAARHRGKGNAEGLPVAKEVNPKACASPQRWLSSASASTEGARRGKSPNLCTTTSSAVNI